MRQMKGINQEQAVMIPPDFCSKFIVLNLHYEKDFFGPAADDYCDFLCLQIFS